MARWLAHLLVPVGIVGLAAVAVLVLDAAGGIEGIPRAEAPLVTGPPAPETPCEQFVPISPTGVTAPRPPATPPPGRLTAIVRTSCGEIEIALASDRFPRTVASFVHLVEHGVYESTEVHRIVPGRLIEGGDPTATGRGGPGYSIREVPPVGTAYPRRTVAMARDVGDPPGASGSRFFIVTAADAGLPPEYAVVGRVTGGFGVVRTIERLAGRDGAGERPVQPVPITGIRIRR